MSSLVSRRQVLAGAGAGAVGAAVGSAATAGTALAAEPSVRGTWLVKPRTPPGSPTFEALAAFAAGGVFVTTGSDEAGTGLGEWTQPGAEEFAFTYLNFHFDQSRKFANTVKVRAAGTFHDARLSGHATLSTLDAKGHRLSPDAKFKFSGKRVPVQAP